MPLISVIVPYHNETVEFMKPLLRSLDSQIAINFNDFEFIFSNDSEVENKTLKEFDFSTYYPNLKNIKFLSSPVKNNPGLSRQFAIDNSTGDYILFCDADDYFIKSDAFYELSINIKKQPTADIFSFQFLEEYKYGENPDEVNFILKNHNFTWVFAKAYKREFLTKNNIRFSENLVFHEDTYFNMVCKYSHPFVICIDDAVYLWTCNKNSITRKDNHDYDVLSRVEYLQALEYAFDKIISEGKNCFEDIMSGIMDTYSILACSRYLYDPKYSVSYENIEKALCKFILKYQPNLFNQKIGVDAEQAIIDYLRTITTFIPRFSVYELFSKLNNMQKQIFLNQINNK